MNAKLLISALAAVLVLPSCHWDDDWHHHGPPPSHSRNVYVNRTVYRPAPPKPRPHHKAKPKPKPHHHAKARHHNKSKHHHNNRPPHRR